MKSSVEEGYKYATRNFGALHGASSSDGYISNIENAIDVLSKDINSFNGYQTDPNMLQGDIAEFWHGDTFNIKAAINNSKNHAIVDRSHGLASPDILIKTDDGDIIEKIGLKYYKDAVSSAQAQSKSFFQRFCEYKYTSGRSNLTISEYFAENGISESILDTDPIYSGQVRLIPADQYEVAVEYLKFKIQKELLTRPEQAKRYQDTLDLLTSKIKTSDGTESIELSRETSQELAGLAKKGKFNPEDYGITTEELMNFSHALAKGIEAGKSAAIITLVLKTAPEVYRCLEKLISEGKLNEDDFRKVGFKALTGTGQGFIRGFIAGTMVTACESGIWGTALKGISPSVIGALTAIVIQSMEDAFFVVKGSMTQQEYIANISKNVFVASCGIGLGSAAAAMLSAIPPAMPFAYMLGNFVGSFVGSFAYIAIDKAFISFAVYSGWTFFNVVKQDYELPQNVLEEIGVDVFKYEQYYPDYYKFDEFLPDEFSLNEYRPDFISIVKRGVIGVRQIGYIAK